MTMQTTYPIFESGQVLTSSHLNSLVEYLEQQDRLTRNKLIGIGVACGLELDYEPQQNRIRITAGCAVTSEGYLIVLEESLLDQFREYAEPIPEEEEASGDITSPYSFFLDAGGNSIQLWELLPTDFTPAPGEPDPTPLTESFINDKVVLLFLECNRESLKNCDINDCSDKGAQMNFTVRTLLVSRQDAQSMLQLEAAIAERPVDRANHPRYGLSELQIEKINPGAHGIDNFVELAARITGIAANLAPQVKTSLESGFDAYSYLLRELYPQVQFPNGPFGNPGYFDNVATDLIQNPLLVQYFYDYVYDVVQSHNEFLREACRLEAECCPSPDRFPKHVLLGEASHQLATAFSIALNQPSDVEAFDPLSADSGAGPQSRPLPLRHHFIPSPLLDGQHELLRKVRSLHYRTYLLAYRYNTNGRLLSQLKITPSKDGDYPLSAKALPFYYDFLEGDDLHRNWAFDKTIKDRLTQVFSHSFVDPGNHPLVNKMEDHNFYRVEGHVGKTLGSVMAELLKQKRELGLTFGIEPVYIGLALKDDVASLALDQQARQRAQQSILKLLLCRMRDLDVFFLIFMAALFFYLFRIVALLSRFSTAAVAGLSAGNTESAQPKTSRFRFSRLRIDRRVATDYLRRIRPVRYRPGRATKDQVSENDPKRSIGRLYLKIQKEGTATNLFDRTLEFARELDPDRDPQVVAQRIYPAVSLLDKTEQLIEVVSAPSLSEFDFDQFEQRYSGFSEAFEDFTSAPLPSEPDPTVVTGRQELQANFGAVAATGPQSVVTGLANEMRERLQKVFAELLLPGYSKRHPGMEHRAGVPVGGTLVLLYTHRNFLLDVLGRNRETIGSHFRDASTGFSQAGAAIAFPQASDILPGLVQTTEPLSDFVVLADFCLPHICCDTDCSDIELTPPTVVQPEPGVITGSVLGQSPVGVRGPRFRILKNAVVQATDLSNQSLVEVKMRNGQYALTAPPGTYRLVAKAKRFTESTRTVTLAAGGKLTEDFLLKPVPEG